MVKQRLTCLCLTSGRSTSVVFGDVSCRKLFRARSCCCILLQLALMLVLTFAPCAGGVFLPPTSANTPLAHVVVSTCCNLHWWCFSFQQLAQILHLHMWWSITRYNLRWWCFSFQPLAQILYLHSCNLHCVVVVYIYIYTVQVVIYTTNLK